MALTTVLSRPGAGGMTLMTAVRRGVLRIIHVERARVTVTVTATVSTQAGQSVAMISVSTPSTSPHLSIPTTQPGLDSPPLTTAATGCATRTTTDVPMEWLDVTPMQTVLMVTTARLTWIFQRVMRLMSVMSTTYISMVQCTVEMKPPAQILLEVSLALVRQVSCI